MLYKPYTYLIGWSHHNKFYYGVRYATKTKCISEFGCHPDDLWKTYFTSSTYVNDFRLIYGEPDIIQVRKIFSSKDEAIKWEEKVLRRLKVKSLKKWLNIAISGSLPVFNGENHPLYGIGHSQESKTKMSLSHMGKTLSEETRKKMSESRKGNKNPMYGLGGMKGKKHSEETRKKMSESKKKTKGHSSEILKKIAQKNSEYKWWTNGKENIRSKECPHKNWTRGRTLDMVGIKNPMYKSDKNKGMLWWHNNVEQIRSKTSPGEGWTNGRLKK